MRTNKKIRHSVWILLGALILLSIPFMSHNARAEEYRREDQRRMDDHRMEEERRLAEQRRLMEERRLRPVAVYVPAPIVVAPPPPSPGIALVIPLSFH